jgi:hypothetical protein
MKAALSFHCPKSAEQHAARAHHTHYDFLIVKDDEAKARASKAKRVSVK